MQQHQLPGGGKASDPAISSRQHVDQPNGHQNPHELFKANLMSKLYMPQGSVLTRQVSGKQLVRTRPGPDGAITYSFRIAPEDIEHVMSGHNWQFTLSGTIADFTLTGSRAALTKAIKARSLPQKNARQYSEEN